MYYVAGVWKEDKNFRVMLVEDHKLEGEEEILLKFRLLDRI